MAIADLEMLLATDAAGATPGRCLVSSVLKDCIAAFSLREDIVVSGKLAGGVYTTAQFTSDLDLLARPEGRTELLARLTAVGLVVREERDHRVLLESPVSRAHVKLRFACKDLEHRALDAPAYHVLFGSRVRFVTAEYLLWLLCRSDELDDYVTAIALLQDGQLDLASIKGMMTKAGDHSALDTLAKWLTAADQARCSTYSKALEHRLAQRSPDPAPEPVWRLGIGGNKVS